MLDSFEKVRHTHSWTTLTSFYGLPKSATTAVIEHATLSLLLLGTRSSAGTDQAPVHFLDLPAMQPTHLAMPTAGTGTQHMKVCERLPICN